MKRRFLIGSFVVVAAVAVPALPAGAHPLGNFTVNHYDGLRFEAHRILDTSVIDAAEIPTSQLASAVDTNGNSTVSQPERYAFAIHRCSALADNLQVVVDTTHEHFSIEHAEFSYRPGVAGLHTSRLVCKLQTSADLSVPRTVSFVDTFEAERVGWHEITALPDGVRLDHAPVPQKSITDELLRYPNDLLSSPLDVRRATLSIVPGTGASTVTRGAAFTPRAGVVARTLNRVNITFNDLVGRRHLTVGVGLFAVLLALLLGASHALLPGHGKTVMAAYIAGRQGSMRDAFVVGATVTGTHTAGVLVLGLALSLSASLAGDAVIRWLGLASGLMIAGLGAGLLVSALKPRGSDRYHHTDAATGDASDEPHGHAHDHSHVHGHVHTRGYDERRRGRAGGAPISRRSLVGMGVAGGLVPSPSALVVLLAAIALGRTIFGIALVISYGLGMAGTLTAAGLILVKVRDRHRDRPRSRAMPFRALAARWTRLLPLTTSGLVIVVGLGLAGRSLSVL